MGFDAAGSSHLGPHSVIVPAFNGWALTAKCIDSIRSFSDTEIVLVDNGSEDETSGVCLDVAGHVTVNIWPNKGFARGCNAGAAVASGEILIFLNNDTEVTNGWLAPILEPFEDLRVGIVGNRLVYPDGRIQHAGIYLDRPGGVLTAHNVLTDERSRTVEAVTGACMAVRAECFRQVGGFDHGYYNGYEDVDLCLKAAELGWHIWYTRRSTVIHYESQSGPSRWAAVRENVQRLNEKWVDVCRS